MGKTSTLVPLVPTDGTDGMCFNIRDLADKCNFPATSLCRRLKKWRKEKPWNVAEIRGLLIDAPADTSLRRESPGKRKPKKLTSQNGSEKPEGMAPTLADLEDKIRRTRDKDEAETLSKQVRSLKALQEVQEREGRTIDAAIARSEIQGVITLFQITLSGWPKNRAAMLVGIPTAFEVETILEGWNAELLAELRRGLERAIEPKREVMAGSQPGIDTADEAVAEPVGGEA